MKAISLWEPWASFIAIGLKRYETRSWTTIYRGPLLICASKKRLPLSQIIDLLYIGRLTLNDLQFGKAVAIVNLTHIFYIPSPSFMPDEIEKKLGDFSPERYAWQLQNVRRFIKPPWVRGKQGLFNVPEMYRSLDTYESV